MSDSLTVPVPVTNSDTHQLTNSLNSFTLLVHSIIYHFFTQLIKSPNSLNHPHNNSITQLTRQIKPLMTDAEKQGRDTDNQRITQLIHSLTHSWVISRKIDQKKIMLEATISD